MIPASSINRSPHANRQSFLLLGQYPFGLLQFPLPLLDGIEATYGLHEADEDPEVHIDLEEADHPHDVEVVLTLTLELHRQPHPHHHRQRPLQQQSHPHPEPPLLHDQALRQRQQQRPQHPHVVLQRDHLVESHEGEGEQEVQVERRVPAHEPQEAEQDVDGGNGADEAARGAAGVLGVVEVHLVEEGREGVAVVTPHQVVQVALLEELVPVEAVEEQPQGHEHAPRSRAQLHHQPPHPAPALPPRLVLVRQQEGEEDDGVDSDVHPQSVEQVGGPLQPPVRLSSGDLVVDGELAGLVAAGLAPKIAVPEGVHEGERDALAATADGQRDEERVVGVHLHDQQRVPLGGLAKGIAAADDQVEEAHGDAVEQREDHLAHGLVEGVVESHQVGEQRRVAVGVPVVGVVLDGRIGVDLVVDVREGHLVRVDVLVGRQEQRKRHPQKNAADHGLPHFPPELHYLQPSQQRGSAFPPGHPTQPQDPRPRDNTIIKEYIQIQMEENDLPPPKQSFCRFYLRGLCVLSAKDCPFAHGVWDLSYAPWQGEAVVYDYHKSKDERQRNTVKAAPVYQVLYDYQQEKIFTLHQLNTEKPARYMVRTLMHQHLYDDFIQLLEATYPAAPLTEALLHREFNRVGFNKILMADVKFSQIAGYLCDNPPHSRYYRAVVNKQNVLIRKAPLSDILEAYRKAFTEILGENAEIDEAVLKKKIYTAQMPEGVPPINAVLKQLKLSLREFLEERLQIQPGRVVAECSVEGVTELASKFLSEELPQRAVEWQEVFRHVSKALKNNNGNLINQAKPQLVLAGHAFLSFPMLQLIYNPALPTPFPRTPCLCPFQKPYPLEELLLSPLAEAEPLTEGESYDIFNFESLQRCAPHILGSGVLGVDLEGRLRRGGFVEMVQLNNGRNTFLFDIWHMNELGDFEAFWLARKVLRNAMLDENIVKIFHDCRHDSIGLHEMLETCIVNVFDTSATETLIGQIEVYERLWKEAGGKEGDKLGSKEGNKVQEKLLAASKQVLAQCGNVRTPGLNDIFKRYEASHGINKNKDKYHKMWSKGDFSFFCKRPIDPEYRDYCIRDVLDLPEVYAKMLTRLGGPAEQLAFWISNEYAKQGFEALAEEKGK